MPLTAGCMRVHQFESSLRKAGIAVTLRLAVCVVPNSPASPSLGLHCLLINPGTVPTDTNTLRLTTGKDTPGEENTSDSQHSTPTRLETNDTSLDKIPQNVLG